MTFQLREPIQMTSRSTFIHLVRICIHIFIRLPIDLKIGSTAFPKPIPWSCHRILLLGLTPYFGDRDLTGRVIAAHTMPMFHGMGVSQLGWTVGNSVTRLHDISYRLCLVYGGCYHKRV